MGRFMLCGISNKSFFFSFFSSPWSEYSPLDWRSTADYPTVLVSNYLFSPWIYSGLFQMFQLVGICGLRPNTFVISPFGIFQSLEQHHRDGKASWKWGRKLFRIFCISLEMVVLLSFGMIIGFLRSSNWFIWWEGGFWPWLGLRYQGKPFLG